LDFEWDDAKDRANQAKHGLSFADALAVFADHDLVVLNASREEDGEARSKAIGRIDGKLFVVVFTKRESVTRIISARRADRREERRYGDSEGKA
jgi:uncharacterized DUF497 family protein